MIKVQELRIGNFLLDREGRTAKVEEINKEEGFKAYSEGGITGLPLNPITLTEEWLIKFGFISCYEKEFKYVFNEDNMLILSQQNECWLMCDIDISVKIKYVHQLQNLFHSLTREELIIK